MSALDLNGGGKKKKPVFIRQDAHKKRRLTGGWRKPKGIDSKARLGLKGHRKNVSAGFGSGPALKGGLKNLVVSSPKELGGIDPKSTGITISATTGLKKKVLIAKRCGELKIMIFNIKDVNEFLKKVEESMISRKKMRQKVKGRMEKKPKKEDDKKEELAKKIEKEEKKEEKEKEKVLKKREI